jgi:hypothetical protein
MNFLGSISKYMKGAKTFAIAIGAIVAALMAASDYWEKHFEPENKGENAESSQQ